MQGIPDDSWNTIKPFFASHLESLYLFLEGTDIGACSWYEWIVDVLL